MLFLPALSAVLPVINSGDPSSLLSILSSLFLGFPAQERCGPVQHAVGVLAYAWVLDQMTSRCYFQPQSFCDSLTYRKKKGK